MKIRLPAALAALAIAGLISTGAAPVLSTPAYAQVQTAKPAVPAKAEKKAVKPAKAKKAPKKAKAKKKAM